MSSAPRVLHRICASCDSEVADEVTHCPRCGGKLVEVLDEDEQLIGTVIDNRFEIRAKLGQGGMGTVYRAWQRSVGREVAIKLLDRSFSRDAMGVRRFLREARLASQLSQPNTVSVFDFGQATDGRLFIAMELIRGRTLHDMVKTEGAFSVERTVRVGVQICDALEAAHAIDIVHRDLKLENVIVLDHPPGRDLLKVLDFGLAKNLRDPGSRATESGMVVGTPRYMSPEATTTGLALPAGDVYGLGVILGELSSGHPLWEGDSLPQLLAHKLDPDSALRRVPAALHAVLRLLLDPEPTRRPTAEQTRRLLGTVSLDGSGIAAEPSAGETTNLRPKTPRSHERAKSPPVAFEATRQLTPGRLVTSAADVRAEPAASASLSPSMLEVTKPPAKKLAGILAIVGAAAVVAAAIVVFAVTRDDDDAAARVRRDAAVALAAPVDAAAAGVVDAAIVELPARVKIQIATAPPGAIVTYGGKTYKTPFELELDRSPQPIELAVKRAGYQPQKLSVTPDRDQELTATLRRVAAKRDDSTPF